MEISEAEAEFLAAQDDGVKSVAGRRLTLARAYAQSLPHPKLESADERIAYIQSLMVEGVWDDETSKELQLVLAKAWSLATDGTGCSAVRHYSASAGRNLHGEARAKAGEYANVALQSLAHIAKHGRYSRIPGDKNAAVNASEKLLRYAGLAEPEEDKNRAPTVQVLVGQVATSPAMSALLGGEKKLNAEASSGGGSPAEVVDELPAADRHGAMVPRR